jgi:hypothetical protein
MIEATEAILSPEDALRLRMHFADLEAALANDVPVYKSLLGTIHSILRADPAVVSILEPEETAMLIAGAERAVGAYIVAKESKPKAKKLTADDF